MYKPYKEPNGSLVTNRIIRTEDGAVIPINPDNTDYQAYLAWLEEGNTPEAAE